MIIFLLIISCLTDSCAQETALPDISPDDELLDLDQVTDETLPDTTTPGNSTDEIDSDPVGEITVKSSFESMSNEELKAICLERGFEVASDESWAHQDYVEAAERCISLEDEMNAIIAQNPELAAELESEIERMAAERNRLVEERDAMLAEKEALEQKLRDAGIDPENITGSFSSSLVSSDGPTSIEETLRQIHVMLFDRIGRDIRIIAKALQYALQPVGSGISILWRYASPSVESILQKCIAITETILEKPQFQQTWRLISKNFAASYATTRTLLLPVTSMTRRIAHELIAELNQSRGFRKARGIIGAVVEPLMDSLLCGWNSAKPNLVSAKQKGFAWFQRVKSEKSSHLGSHNN